MKYLLTCLLLVFFSTAIAATNSYKIGDLVIEAPYSRSTPPMAPVGGGFMTIINNGSEDDTLISGSASFSKAFEIHEMSMKDGIMKMAELENGLTIPAGETVLLKPGGYHVMFITLSEQLKPDELRKATLVFEKAGEIEVEFLVKDILKMDHSTMDHSKMKHSDMSDHKMDHSKMKMDHSTMETTEAE
jgi:copper(I)-binding protein